MTRDTGRHLLVPLRQDGRDSVFLYFLFLFNSKKRKEPKKRDRFSVCTFMQKIESPSFHVDDVIFQSHIHQLHKTHTPGLRHSLSIFPFPYPFLVNFFRVFSQLPYLFKLFY
jgi:hypothetical protein